MKSILSGAVIAALLCSSAAFADPDNHRDQQDWNGSHQDNGQHRGWGHERGNGHRWNRGERMGYNDWNTSERVDYRQYHLRQPPRGYEWRRQNNQFVLAAVTTGLIMSIIMNNGR